MQLIIYAASFLIPLTRTTYAGPYYSLQNNSKATSSSAFPFFSSSFSNLTAAISLVFSSLLFNVILLHFLSFSSLQSFPPLFCHHTLLSFHLSRAVPCTDRQQSGFYWKQSRRIEGRIFNTPVKGYFTHSTQICTRTVELRVVTDKW